ncbi:Replication factor A protein 1 [Orobanche minor]
MIFDRQSLHTNEIRALLGKDTLSDRPNTGLNISAQQTVPINDILATAEPGRFTSIVKGQLLRTNQKFVYLCCDRCHCLTSAEYGCLFECRSCRLNKIATPRYRFSLSVFDETGELEVTMFGKEAEKLLNLSADDFWQKYQEDTSFVHTLINSKLEETLLQIEIQSKTFLRQDGTTILSYTVQSLNCQKTAPLPTEQPSSCGVTYLLPTENSNHNKNITTSTQAPPDIPDTDITLLSNKSKIAQHTRPEHNKDASKSSRGRTLKAKKLD